jgi:hypothetical protein
MMIRRSATPWPMAGRILPRRFCPPSEAVSAPRAHIAFHIGAMYVLEIAQQAIARWSGEEASVALGMVEAELEQFRKAHAAVIQ